MGSAQSYVTQLKESVQVDELEQEHSQTSAFALQYRKNPEETVPMTPKGSEKPVSRHLPHPNILLPRLLKPPPKPVLYI
jgi:hypothetical protein